MGGVALAYQPVEAAMRLLHVLMGLRNGRRGARSSGGMLLVMMGLAGLLTKKPVRGTDSKRR
jgi:hypothetical protein